MMIFTKTMSIEIWPRLDITGSRFLSTTNASGLVEAVFATRFYEQKGKGYGGR